MNEWEWELLEGREALESVRVFGIDLRRGERVRLWPREGGDILDMALAGKTAIIESIAHPGIAINWDPANSFCEGDIAYPDGYHAVRGHVRNVHFKDARLDADGQPKFVGEGAIDWAGQIAALARDGYEGCIAIEPHLEPRVPAVRAALERLRGLLAAAPEATPDAAA